MFKVNVKGEASSDRQLIALFQEIGVAESNGDVRILTGSCEIVVCTHAQYKVANNCPEWLARRRAAFKLQCIRNCHLFWLRIYLSVIISSSELARRADIATTDVLLETIIHRQPDESAFVGQRFTLPCLTSSGKSAIWWYQENARSPSIDVFNVRGDVMNSFKRSGRFTLRRDFDGDYSLVIENVTLIDAGLYTCAIDDGYGDYFVTRMNVSGTCIRTGACCKHGAL